MNFNASPTSAFCTFPLYNSHSWIARYCGRKDFNCSSFPLTLPHGYPAMSLSFPHSFLLWNSFLLQDSWPLPTHVHTYAHSLHAHLPRCTTLRGTGPLSPDVHLCISKSLRIYPLGLLWPIKTSIAIPGPAELVCSWVCPVCFLFVSLHCSLFSLSFHPVIYSVSKQNFHPVQRPRGHESERMMDGLCLQGDIQSCFEETWKASSTGHGIGA